MQTPKLLTISILILIISFLFNISASDDSETTGTLTVDTRPSGLNVYVDGKIAGKTPLKNYAVPAGKRVISVETEPCFKNVLYYSWNRPVFVENGKDTYVEIVPAPILTNLKVEGIAINGKKLENTSIFVDGVNTGIQPGSFEVPVCSKLLEVTDESGRNVVYSSELDLLKGVSVPRNEKNYEITSVSEKKENDIVLFQVPENSNDQNSGLTDSSGSVEKTPFRSPLKTVKKNSEVFGPYKWIGTALILTGAVSAGLGGFFDYKAVKEFDKYNEMGDPETIRKLIEEGSFDEEGYISGRDSHYNKGKDYSIARTVLYAAGGAMFVTGVVLLFVPGAKKIEKKASFMLMPSFNGLNISAEISF